MTGPRLIVVGGGLAGLAAALTAADHGAEVHLLERAPRLGGATWSFTRDGITYDNGQHVFMRCCTSYRAFLERIGSTGDVTLQDRMDVPVRRPDGTTRRLRRVGLPAPLHLGPALARYRHLSWGDRLRSVRVALGLRRLDLDDDTLDEQSFGDWLRQRGVTAHARAALWDLVCLPTVNLRADDASLLVAAKVFKTGLLDTADGGDIGWADVPLQQLHGTAARQALSRAGATVRTEARVTAVHTGGEGLTVSVDQELLAADAVVLAVPHDAVGRLLDPATIDDQDRLAELGRSPIINVHLVYDRPVLDEPFVAVLDSPLQFVFDRTRQAGVSDGGQCVAISLSAADDHLGSSRDELVDRFSAEMKRVFPAAAEATLVSSMVTREVAATFRAGPGTRPRRPGTRTKVPGLFLAGAWTDTGWPATMEGAVRSGNRAAEAALAHLGRGIPARAGAAA